MLPYLTYYSKTSEGFPRTSQQKIAYLVRKIRSSEYNNSKTKIIASLNKQFQYKFWWGWLNLWNELNLPIQMRVFVNVHYVKSVQIRSFLWSIFFCIQSEYRKIPTRKNSVFGHFSRSESIVEWDMSFASLIKLFFEVEPF